jgi:deoxyribodipyrimidine photolyase-related protein
VQVLDARGFATSMAEFGDWADSRGSKRLLLEDHYRAARRRLGVLMGGDEPAGGRWNYDADNREAPPKNHQGKAGGDVNSGIGVAEPWWPVEDDIDEQVRHDLDRWERVGDVRFIGRDGPRRFPATRQEALTAFAHFVDRRLAAFGPTRTPCWRTIRGWRTH